MALTPSAKQAALTKKLSGTNKVNNSKKQKTDNFKEGKPFDSSLEDLYKSDLKDMLWAENHLVAALPKMIDAASTHDLKKALASHLKETIQQVNRLKTVFDQLSLPAIPKKCVAMEGLTMSGEQAINYTLSGSPGRETGIINAGIKVEQFEITCYNGLIKMANRLGHTDAEKVFRQNLQEEVNAFEKLNHLSDSVAKN